MFAQRVIPVILLVVLGMIGCAPSSSRYVRPNAYGNLPPPATNKEVNKIEHTDVINRTLDTARSTGIEPPTPATVNELASKLTSPSIAIAKTTARQNLPAQSRKTGASQTTAVGLRQYQEPKTDDRAADKSDTIEMEVDKPVEQPEPTLQLQFSREVINNPKVRYFIHQYARTTKHHFAMQLAKSGRFMPLIAKVFAEEGVPQELAYLAMIESGFETHVSSPQGAGGLWQFVPSTAQRYGLKIDRWIDERRDPVKSTRAAATYLKELHQYYGRWYLALAAYNAGPGTINKALESTGAQDYWRLRENSVLSDETRDFVPKLVAVALIAADPKKYGFRDIKYDDPFAYDEVAIERPVSLSAAAKMAQTTLATMKELNPGLLHNSTPPNQFKFVLRVPAGRNDVFAKALTEMPTPDSNQIVTHEVRKGDTLIAIARRYGQGVRELMSFNGLVNSRLRIGQKLKVFIGRGAALLR